MQASDSDPRSLLRKTNPEFAVTKLERLHARSDAIPESTLPAELAHEIDVSEISQPGIWNRHTHNADAPQCHNRLVVRETGFEAGNAPSGRFATEQMPENRVAVGDRVWVSQCRRLIQVAPMITLGQCLGQSFQNHPASPRPA